MRWHDPKRGIAALLPPLLAGEGWGGVALCPKIKSHPHPASPCKQGEEQSGLQGLQRYIEWPVITLAIPTKAGMTSLRGLATADRLSLGALQACRSAAAQRSVVPVGPLAYRMLAQLALQRAAVHAQPAGCF